MKHTSCIPLSTLFASAAHNLKLVLESLRNVGPSLRPKRCHKFHNCIVFLTYANKCLICDFELTSCCQSLREANFFFLPLLLGGLPFGSSSSSESYSSYDSSSSPSSSDSVSITSSTLDAFGPILPGEQKH